MNRTLAKRDSTKSTMGVGHVESDLRREAP